MQHYLKWTAWAYKHFKNNIRHFLNWNIFVHHRYIEMINACFSTVAFATSTFSYETHFHLVFNQTAVSKAGRAAHLLPRLHPRSCEPPPHRNARVQHFSRISQKRLGNYLPDGESWFMVIHRVFLWHEPGYQDFWLPPSVIKRLTEIICLSLIHLITIMATTENLLYIEIKKKILLSWTSCTEQKWEKSFRVIKEQC